MNTVTKFNGLNGARKVSRQFIVELVAEAKQDEQYIVANRLESVLSKYPDAKSFNWTNSYPAYDTVPSILLDCIEEETENHEEAHGLGKPVSSNDVYQMITDLMINTVKKVGHLPWQKEWTGSGDFSAMNYVSKNAYSGINFYLLNFDCKYDENGEPYLVPIEFIQPYYLTFNQIVEAGALLKKGSKGRDVIYYNFILNYKDADVSFNGTDVKKFNFFATQHNLSSEQVKENLSKIPLLKYYTVFRADDCTGLKFPAPPEPKEVHPIEIAQNIIDYYPNHPKYNIAKDGKAYYIPMADEIFMPKIEAFTHEANYYSTFFHEIIHSTGHSSRLDRGNDTRLRDGSDEDKKAYAFEELVAELGAVYLSSEAGTLFYTKENSAKYLRGWNSKLIENMENDNRFFIKASAQAHKASTLVLGDRKHLYDYEAPVKKVEKKKPIKKNTEVKKIAEVKKTKAEINEKFTKPKKEIKPKDTKKIEVPANGQLALFGAKKAKLNAPIVEEIPKVPGINIQNLDKESLAYKMANRNNIIHEYYHIPNEDIATFLGQIEKKKKESVVITIAGSQGSMKTRFCFQLMNCFGQNYKVGHASIEEHPESALYTDKVEQYLDQTALNNIKNPEIRTMDDVHKLIRECDVIIIDSFSKLQEMQRGLGIDKDLRKAYDGKLFIIIYQLTTDGKMRGGSSSQFDGDIISFIEKMPNYEDNYVFHDKNRYNKINLEDLKFNIFKAELIKPKTEPTQNKHQFSFVINPI